jgi:hypothetical protein
MADKCCASGISGAGKIKMINHPNRSKKAKAEPKEVIVSFKGFDANWQCRGFQFEVGKTYETKGEISCCSNGFHACEIPFDVWGYYGPGNSKFAIVEQSGKTARKSGDSKIASAEITIKAELTLPEFIKRGVEWVINQVDFTNAPATNTGERSAATNTGYQSAATNTGDQSAATNTGERSAATNTGDQSAATNTGDRSAATNTGYQSAATNTGYQSAATNTGYQSAATNTGDRSAATNTGYQSAATNTGDRSAATNTGYQSAATNTGDQSAATNTGYQSAATNTGDQSAATNTGDRSAATNTGYQSAATNTGDRSAATNTGYQSAATNTGKFGAAFSTGIEGRVSGAIGCSLHLDERRENYSADNHGEILNAWAGIVGRDGIKPDTFYILRDGKPVEAQ